VGVASPIGGRAVTGRWLALFLLALANLALIAIVASSSTSLTDIIAPLTGHLIGIGLTATVALLVQRRMLTVLAAGVAATIGLHVWLGLSRCCEAAPSPLATASVSRIDGSGAGSPLTVLSLNAWHQQSDPKKLEDYLRTAPADVVALSEFGPDRKPLLGRLKQIYPYQVDCADAWACSLALLSRQPFAASGAVGVSGDMPAFVWARFAGSLTVIGTKLHRPSRDPWLHERQMSALAQFLRRIDEPLVLTGDLNTSPWSSSFRKLRSATRLVPANVLMPTWPAWPIALPQVALDHVFVSPELAVTGAGTGPAVGSDHLPVWARIERRPASDRGKTPVRNLASRLAAAGAHLGGELLADLGREHGGARDLSR
jgi:endonuclease/exonuclease/phosphatase (EEP) superfamily protein YafD